MKKVTEITAVAFKEGRNKNVSNTTASAKDGVKKLFLHGNKIATQKGNKLTISDCDWQTSTTKERLNGLLKVLGTNYRIYQNNFVWYLESSRDDKSPIIIKEGKNYTINL